MFKNSRSMHKARYYKKLQDGIVQCTCCDLKCQIRPGSTGVCGVRQNIDGDLMSLVYGNVTDIHVDEVGKKGLFHYLLGAEVLSIGTVGCNFACSFCQNWATSQFPKRLKKQSVKDRKTFDMDKEISNVSYQLSPKQAVKYCLDKNLPAIAYTYNEPTVFLEYALDTAKLAKAEGIKNIFVSNGSMSEEVVDDIAEHIDAIHIDLKAFTNKFYQKHCKFSLDPVLRNIETFYKKGVWMEITTLLIPDENDSEHELKKCADFISGISP
ncbi:MAG: radical SAM protein, partial [Patescibacteria group bacterium]|nr:radical SAM protein [Patescibacteria group bacterium]